MKHLLRFKNLLWATALLAFPSMGMNAQLVRSIPTVDAVAYQDPAETPHASNLFVSGETDKQRVAYLKFDISEHSGLVVKHATLGIRGGAPTASMTVKLARAGADFTRADITWANKPTTSGELATLELGSGAMRFFNPVGEELINYINQKLLEGAQEVAFAILYKEGGTNSNWIGGTNDGANYKPELHLEFDTKTKTWPLADAVAYEDPDADKHATNLFIHNETGKRRFSYLKFDLTPYAGKTVKEVNLSIRGGAPALPMKVKLMRSGDDFTREDISWENKPTTSGAELATLDLAAGRFFFQQNASNLVNYVNEKLLAGATEISFCIQWKEGGPNSNWIGGLGDGTAHRPEMSLEFTNFNRMVPSEDAVALQDTDEAPVATNLLVSGEVDKQKISYLKFNISELAGLVVKDAKLGIRGGAPAAPMTVKLARTGSDFTRADITWANKPATSGELATLELGSGAIRFFEPVGNELIKYINQELLAGAQEIAFAILHKEGGPNSNWIGGTRDGVNYKPELHLEFDGKTKTWPQMDAVAYEDPLETKHASNLFIYNEDGKKRLSYLKFDISQYAGQTAKDAKLSIRGGAPAQPMQVVLRRTGDNFTRDELTWDNKPGISGPELATLDLASGRFYFEQTNTNLLNYINEKLLAGATEISFRIDWKAGGPNSNWIGGMGDGTAHRPELELSLAGYESILSPSTFHPDGGDYIQNIEVEIKNTTPNASIYYTLDGTDPDETSTLYSDKFMLSAVAQIENITVKAKAFAEGFEPSEITSADFTIKPVSTPTFDPSPQVTYQKSVMVRILVEPADAEIIFTTNGADPTIEGELYEGEFLLTQSSLVRAIAYSADGEYTTPEAEAAYEIVETVPAPGIGPGGVGFTDLSRENQPALSLWLRAHDIVGINNGEKVNLWNDASGNDNHAHNDEGAVGTQIPSTGENWKAAPTFLTEGPNSQPTVHFGSQTGENQDLKNLIVSDADNLDGGSGLSIFLVIKRNQLLGDFAGVFQKRDIRNQPAEAAYILEMDGGANPEKMQFAIARDVFIKSLDPFNTEDYYIVNVGLNSKISLASFMTNGAIKSATVYNKPIQSTSAPIILGGFQPMNVAEVVLFNSDVNNAQSVLVHNYLAAKYGIGLVGGLKYTHATYIHDIIGVGKKLDLLEVDTDVHDMSFGGGLEIKANSIAASDDFVFAGHNGAAINDENDAKSWGREWYVKPVAGGASVILSFDFATEGVTATPGTDYKLWYKADAAATWTDKGITPTIEGTMLKFNAGAVTEGYYAIGIAQPIATSNRDNEMNRSELAVYPNPVKDVLYITAGGDLTGSSIISIVSVTGQVVKTVSVESTYGTINSQIPVSDLKAGTYFIRIQNGNGVATKAFIKR